MRLAGGVIDLGDPRAAPVDAALTSLLAGQSEA
jgi:hypothetical protein